MKNGLVNINDYQNLTNSEVYSFLEKGSEDFVRKHLDDLTEYDRKWVANSFKQWSRKYEYTYVFESIKKKLEPEVPNQSKFNVLDAGSGITFFPFFCKENLKIKKVTCLDYDEGYAPVFDKINKHSTNKVEFIKASLTEMPFENSSFDIVYSVSVIEHTTDPLRIINEIDRVLKPGGMLVLTFDLSLDGSQQISIDIANRIIDSLANSNYISLNEVESLDSSLSVSSHLYTAIEAYKYNPESLWRSHISLKGRVYMTLYTLLTRGKIFRFPPRLAFYCGSFLKGA